MPRPPSSRRPVELIWLAAGGKPLIYKTGHSLIKAKMKELKAPLAGEMSGHMFFGGDYLGFDDALFAAIMAGASGYLLKQVQGTDLVDGVRRVAAGQSMLDPAVTAKVLERVRLLPAPTPRLLALCAHIFSSKRMWLGRIRADDADHQRAGDRHPDAFRARNAEQFLRCLVDRKNAPFQIVRVDHVRRPLDQMTV